MFDRAPGNSTIESWAEIYRRRRGVDQWLLIEATVIYREVIPGDEGAPSYKLTLRYKPSAGPASGTFLNRSLTVNEGTTLASADVDDVIRIYCNPENPERIAQEDVTQLSYNIRFWIFFVLVALFAILAYLNGHPTGGGGE
jgi:hypothetical protein